MKLYNKFNINSIINYPIDDLNEKTCAKEVFAASQYLYDMRNNKGLKVFVNCKTGISRSPTVVMTYLALYKRVNDWQNLDAINILIKSNFKLAFGNSNLV